MFFYMMKTKNLSGRIGGFGAEKKSGNSTY
jgi:hypothetical protein